MRKLYLDTSGSPFGSISMHEKNGQNCKMPFTAVGHRTKFMTLFAKNQHLLPAFGQKPP